MYTSCLAIRSELLNFVTVCLEKLKLLFPKIIPRGSVSKKSTLLVPQTFSLDINLPKDTASEAAHRGTQRKNFCRQRKKEGREGGCNIFSDHNIKLTGRTALYLPNASCLHLAIFFGWAGLGGGGGSCKI